MPDFNGGEDRVFTEWKIGYTIDGEKYTQIVTDNGYEKGDMIDIKYNPENPQEFYLDDEKSKVEVTEEEKEAEEKRRKRLSAMRLSLSVSCLAFSVWSCL